MTITYTNSKLNFNQKNIVTWHNAKERAREIAIAEAKRKAKAKALLAASLESGSATPRRSPLPETLLITPEIQLKAKESEKKLSPLAGEDFGATDDYEGSN